MWQPELDVLVLDEKPFLTGEDTADSGRFFHWAYSINTSKGLYRKSEENRKELFSIGVKEDVIDSKEFKDFSNQFNSSTPISKVYELYTKTLDKPKVEKIGSMKNNNTKEEKTYYSPEDVDKLTPEDYDDPVIFKRVHDSMAKWK